MDRKEFEASRLSRILPASEKAKLVEVHNYLRKRYAGHRKSAGYA